MNKKLDEMFKSDFLKLFITIMLISFQRISVYEKFEKMSCTFLGPKVQLK